jgi:hypothetical protein
MCRAGRIRREQLHERNAPLARVLCLAGTDPRCDHKAMYDASAGRGLTAVAGVGICDRIIASRRSGSVQVAAGTVDSAVADAGATGTAHTVSANATAATARTGA